jgi:hypothetical protein
MFGVDLLPKSLRSLCKIAADIAHDRSPCRKLGLANTELRII